jgi:hypothetical protein
LPLRRLDRATRSYADDFHGMVVELTSLGALELPADVRPTPLDLAIGVTHHKPPGGAWGQLVVFVVVQGSPSQAGRPTTAIERPLR